MNRMMMIAVATLLTSTPALAATKLRGGGFRHGQRYDPSLDFSKQFDEEVRARPAAEPDATSKTRHHRARAKSSRRPRAGTW